MWIVAQDVSWLQKASWWGGWGLSGRVPISSPEQNELQQLLEAQEAAPAGISLPWTQTPDWLTKLNFVCLTVRPNKWKHQSLEQRKFYCRAKQGDWVACAHKKRNPLIVLGENFYGQNLEWGLQGVTSNCVMVRKQGGIPEIKGSIWSYHPLPEWGP